MHESKISCKYLGNPPYPWRGILSILPHIQVRANSPYPWEVFFIFSHMQIPSYLSLPLGGVVNEEDPHPDFLLCFNF